MHKNRSDRLAYFIFMKKNMTNIFLKRKNDEEVLNEKCKMCKNKFSIRPNRLTNGHKVNNDLKH